MARATIDNKTETHQHWEVIRPELLHQHQEACSIGIELRQVTLPPLKTIAATGEMLQLSFYFELFRELDGQWEVIGPFSDRATCAYFAARVSAAGIGVKRCERWVPAF